MTQHTLLSQGSQFRLYLGSSILLISLALSSLIFCPMIIFAGFLPFSVRYALSLLWTKSVLYVARYACGLHYEVHGLENLRGESVAIVLSKHQSAWETIALRAILPAHTLVLKESLLWIPFWGWAMALLKPIAINRRQQNQAMRTVLKKGSAYLTQGLWVVVFPEGTRTAPGEDKKFNAGGAMLAQKTGCPVIPIAHNAGKYWPRYSFLKYPGVITVKIGPAIVTQGLKANEINAQAHAWIQQAMQEIQ